MLDVFLISCGQKQTDVERPLAIITSKCFRHQENKVEDQGRQDYGAQDKGLEDEDYEIEIDEGHGSEYHGSEAEGAAEQLALPGPAQPAPEPIVSVDQCEKKMREPDRLRLR